MENNKFKQFLTSSAGKAAMIVVFYALIFLLIMLFTNIFGGFAYAGAALAVIFAIFGWKALNKIRPDIFLFMPLIGWLIYFFIKGVLSVFVGIFVAPFVIAKKISTYIQESING